MRKNKIINIIYTHLLNNYKDYFLITLLFIIGIFLGVLFINNIQETQMNEITTYFNNFTNNLKEIEDLNHMELLKTTINKNIILGITLWFFGTTVIRNTNCIWNYNI